MAHRITRLRMLHAVPRIAAAGALWVIPLAAYTHPSVLTGGVAIAVALTALGLLPRLEGFAARHLLDGRRLSIAEEALLAPVLARLEEWGLRPMHVIVAPSIDTWLSAAPFGRGTLVLRPSVLERLHQGSMTIREGRIVLAQALTQLSACPDRYQVAREMWCAPLNLVLGLTRFLGSLVPGANYIWKARGFLGIVAATAALGHPWTALAVIALTVASYAGPYLRLRISNLCERLVDVSLAHTGRGTDLAILLRHYGHPASLERSYDLQAPPRPSAPEWMRQIAMPPQRLRHPQAGVVGVDVFWPTASLLSA